MSISGKFCVGSPELNQLQQYEKLQIDTSWETEFPMKAIHRTKNYNRIELKLH